MSWTHFWRIGVGAMAGCFVGNLGAELIKWWLHIGVYWCRP